jgi:ornithine cyclodeaminase/alanine dehydrogenase-like protein (mu-crystallin family)
MAYQILTDVDIERSLKMPDLVSMLEDIFRIKADDGLLTPPRYQINGTKGSLLISGGGELYRKGGVIGIRLYDNFAGKWPNRDDVTSLYDNESGTFKGVIIGTRLADMRTGAIGGVAVKYMSRVNATSLAIIGSGHQARTQLEAALSVRKFERITIYSRSAENRSKFSREMSEKVGLDVLPVDSPENAVRDADVVICATVSTAPVIRAKWLKPTGVHINSIGPKFAGSHELDIDIIPNCNTIATDSAAQMDAYPKPFFLTGTPYKEKIVELEDIVAGKRSARSSPDDNTLFISTGLAGTEIAVAGRLLEMIQKSKK